MKLHLPSALSVTTVKQFAAQHGYCIRQLNLDEFAMVPESRRHDAHRQCDYTLGATAKHLGIGTLTLFRVLRERKILDPDNQPYRQYIEEGLFVVEHKTYDSPIGAKPYTQTRVTQKGRDWLQHHLNTTTEEQTP